MAMGKLITGCTRGGAVSIAGEAIRTLASASCSMSICSEDALEPLEDILEPRVFAVKVISVSNVLAVCPTLLL